MSTTEESPSSEYVQDSYTNTLGDIDNMSAGQQGGADAQNQPNTLDRRMNQPVQSDHRILYSSEDDQTACNISAEQGNAIFKLITFRDIIYVHLHTQILSG